MKEEQHADHNTLLKRLSICATSLDKMFLHVFRTHLAVSIYKKSRTESHQHVSHADRPCVSRTLVQPADPRLHASVNQNPTHPEPRESRGSSVVVFVFDRFVPRSTRYHNTTRCSQRVQSGHRENFRSQVTLVCL